MFSILASIAISIVCGLGILFCGIVMSVEHEERKFANAGEHLLFSMTILAVVTLCLCGVHYAATLY